MDSIYFEKQEALLCGQHALNNLLQGSYFSAADLSVIAQRLDSEENAVLDSKSKNNASQNMNDSGFFSIQVISEALKAFSLEIIPIGHPSVASTKADPLSALGFICNQNLHWLTMRKFGEQWFELNSVKKGPELVSHLYLDMYLQQLQHEGYQVFIVEGIYPACEAEQVISLCPVIPPPPVSKEKFLKDKHDEMERVKLEVFGGKGNRLGSMGRSASPLEEDPELAEAIRLSLQANDASTSEEGHGSSREREGGNASSSPSLSEQADVRLKRQHFLDRFK